MLVHSATTPCQLFVNGKWRPAQSGDTKDIRNPATGDVVGAIAWGSAEDAREAMDSAAAALPLWRSRTSHERAEALYKTATLIRQRASVIARTVTEENGKPLSEAMAEVVGCAGWFEWCAEEGKRAYGRLVPTHHPGKRLWVLRQPVGVVAAITPWNFPVNLLCRKLAAALAAGCTIVARPASQTPLSAMQIVACLDEAGLPPGTVSLVTGPAEAVTNVFFEHPACRKVAFTGSTEVGKQLIQRAGRQVTKLSLELGGHAPLIVFPDVDLATAVEQTVAGKFRNAGQSCIAPTRIYVHRDIYEPFLSGVVERTKKIVVGNGLDPQVQMGPLFSEAQLKQTEAFIADATSKGAKVATGGKRLVGAAFDRGFFFSPTVLDGISPTMRLVTEEIFGPILPVIPFSKEDEVVAAANRTPYGLAAYVLVRDMATTLRVSESLEYGVVGVNETSPTVPHAPFGGWKESGIGREGGSEGLDAYLETKFVTVGI